MANDLPKGDKIQHFLQLKSIYLSPQKINDQNGEQKQADVTFRFLVT